MTSDRDCFGQAGYLATDTSNMSEAEMTKALDSFLAQVERRALAMARVAVGEEADAMDIVQDAMMQLVKNYPRHPAGEWRALFYRILHNRINDFFRRKKVRDKVIAWLPGSRQLEDDNQIDPIELSPGEHIHEPDINMERQQNLEQISAAVTTLPKRQREAFMLRCWEGFSTAETAIVMQCSEGSVKTHYSRAMTALRILLENISFEDPEP